MTHSHYEEVSLAEMELSDDGATLLYPCPCGDTFELALSEFAEGADVAQCPTCSLTIQIKVSDDERRAFLKAHPIGGGEATG